MNRIIIEPLRKPITGEIEIPGSKSYTNRALVLAALSEKPVTLKNVLISDDTLAMVNCLKTLGINIKQKGNNIIVKSNIYKQHLQNCHAEFSSASPEILKQVQDDDNNEIGDINYNLYTNLSGTTIRFILALSCLIPGVKKIYGKESLNNRPVKDLVDGLKQLGADISYSEKEGHPPIIVKSSTLKSGKIKLNGNISSQYLSAVLMIAPIIGNVEIDIAGNQVSKSYIDMTIQLMQAFGVKVINKNYKKYKVQENQKYLLKKYNVEGDWSAACYFLALAAITQSKLTLKNLNINSLQGDIKFLQILEKMGNIVKKERDQITITGKGIKPIKVTMADCPDQVQTLAVIASLAKGQTTISGIETLKHKETDRVKAIITELKKVGIKAYIKDNQLIINGGSPKGGNIDTYNDHRMAMSFAILGTIVNGISINDPDVVSKSFPKFWKKLKSLGVKLALHKSCHPEFISGSHKIPNPPKGISHFMAAQVRDDIRTNNKNIVLIGMRGSGKTTIAELLAQKLNKRYYELDEMLVKKNKKTIPEIVEKFGWDYFREKETEIVEEVSKLNNVIISTGGGVVVRPENIEKLKQNGFIFWLQVNIDNLLERIGEDPNRPSLTGKSRKEDMIEVLEQRKDLYKSASDEIIDTDLYDAEKIADIIVSKLNQYH